jgi:hypothetical protein
VLAALTECFGGLAMIVGFLVRPAAVGLVLVMLVAIAKVHWANGFFINWSFEPGKGHGFEMNLALIGMALAVSRGRGGSPLDRPVAPPLVTWPQAPARPDGFLRARGQRLALRAPVSSTCSWAAWPRTWCACLRARYWRSSTAERRASIRWESGPASLAEGREECCHRPNVICM